MAKFEMYTDKRGEYRFRLVASNGKNILASEGYKSKAACENGIASVKKNSKDDSKYDLQVAENGKVFFNLKASNGQVIGTSQMYESEETRAIGIASVKENAADAPVEEV